MPAKRPTKSRMSRVNNFTTSDLPSTSCTFRGMWIMNSERTYRQIMYMVMLTWRGRCSALVQAKGLAKSGVVGICNPATSDFIAHPCTIRRMWIMTAETADREVMYMIRHKVGILIL